jgi:hypothetical protein
MQKLIMSLALAVALPAFAQTSGSNATGNANAGSVAIVNLNQSAPPSTTSTNTSTVNSTSSHTSHETYKGEQDVDYSGKYSIKSAPTVYAPPVGVTAPCVIGASLGVSGMGFGFGGGTGIVDSGCERRAVSSLMQSYGHIEAAKEMLCDDPTAAAAYARAGMPCKAASSKPAAAAPAPSTMAQSGSTSEQACLTDPYIAVRLGKPVCK